MRQRLFVRHPTRTLGLAKDPSHGRQRGGGGEEKAQQRLTSCLRVYDGANNLSSDQIIFSCSTSGGPVATDTRQTWDSHTHIQTDGHTATHGSVSRAISDQYPLRRSPPFQLHFLQLTRKRVLPTASLTSTHLSFSPERRQSSSPLRDTQALSIITPAQRAHSAFCSSKQANAELLV